MLCMLVFVMRVALPTHVDGSFARAYRVTAASGGISTKNSRFALKVSGLPTELPRQHSRHGI